ncbi:protein PLASTID REDOX INSENSITIVE 2 [Cinnamomum micranthum f. kanehirae]|uniref:Protein PLASTID REDOX INSENSITIVE 2 n=1 Tax=Cinnamomum micranthum f. kanehirae TaxID=337451 RepID=A0A3S3MNW7_9MAGN|nr:protein PLASTID REDOX INSENSITIVE 2 [Cinnamomum micranthum f. kanehirae]
MALSSIPSTSSILFLSPFHFPSKSRRSFFSRSALILHPLFSTSLFSSLLTTPSRPISSNIYIKPPRAWSQPKYVYPDPIPEFAKAETQKFRSELRKRLAKDRETFGDDMDTVVKTCAEIFNDFLHKEYGGPGTLLVEPFTDMLLALKEKKLPGAPVAARAALLWAQNYVDQDWELWISQRPK